MNEGADASVRPNFARKMSGRILQNENIFGYSLGQVSEAFATLANVQSVDPRRVQTL